MLQIAMCPSWLVKSLRISEYDTLAPLIYCRLIEGIKMVYTLTHHIWRNADVFVVLWYTIHYV